MRDAFECSLRAIVFLNRPCMVGAFWTVLTFAFPAVVLSADRPPEVEAAIQKGLRFLESKEGMVSSAETGLVVYTTLASGQTPDHPLVKALLPKVVAKIGPDGYRPTQHHTYEAGVDAMALVAADRQKYLPQIQAIADFLMREQRAYGGWDYLGQEHQGDTSISQYGMLGLWAAARAGVAIPPKVWDQSARWHIKTQLNDGAFAYQPLNSAPNPMHSMTVAGIGSLCIARLHLTNGQSPEIAEPEPDPEEPKPKKKDKAFGVLERVNPADNQPLEDNAKPANAPAVYRVTSTKKELDGHIGRALGWLTKNFTVDKPVGWGTYYLYGLERAAALTGSSKIGNNDWYKLGSDYLIKTQKEDGSWFDPSGHISATNFGVLFLVRATEKIVPNAPPPPVARAPKVPTFGGGVLAGGRGLPKDLSNVDTSGGSIKEKKTDTPLDRLLAELENPKAENVEDAQAAIVEAVQVGQREELIGKKDLLLKLVKDKRVEVRRTAYWALGRCKDLRVAPVLIEGLNDADFDVSIEARNSLCVLSRRPRGFGLPDDVLGKLPENATEVERDAAYEKWRREDAGRWREWYQTVRPYDERDNLTSGF